MFPLLDVSKIQALFSQHKNALQHPIRNFELSGHRLDFARERYLMGVINLSSDSWYKESVCEDPGTAIETATRLVKEGARFIDLGAESSLPDAARRTPKEQLQLLLPVLKPLAEAGVLVSVESYHPEVLEACAKAGAAIFNLTGTETADDVFALAARHEVGVVCCYVVGKNVREVRSFDLDEDMVPRQLEFFRKLLGRAEAQGVNRCFVDPGLGFYYRDLGDGDARVKYQLKTLMQAFRFYELGYPVFNILPHAQTIFGAEDRRAAEPFFMVPAILGGTHMIRTHEVRTVAKVLEGMRRFGEVA